MNDKKYTNNADDASKLVEILARANVGPDVSARIIEVVNHVSYSTEKKNPERTRQVFALNPELGIVQDADRLDAIGAIGIGRAFTFGGAKMPQSSMQLPREHIDDKLVKLEGLMKTNSGRLKARKRTERLRQFAHWWDEECSL